MDVSSYLVYPAIFTKCNEGDYTIHIRGIDGAISEGNSFEEALKMAHDLILDWAYFCVQDGEIMPKASPLQDGDVAIKLTLDEALKIVLRNIMIENKIKAIDIANKLGITAQNLNTKLNLFKSTKLDYLEQMFNAIGKNLKITIC